MRTSQHMRTPFLCMRSRCHTRHAHAHMDATPILCHHHDVQYACTGHHRLCCYVAAGWIHGSSRIVTQVIKCVVVCTLLHTHTHMPGSVLCFLSILSFSPASCPPPPPSPLPYMMPPHLPSPPNHSPRIRTPVRNPSHHGSHVCSSASSSSLSCPPCQSSDYTHSPPSPSSHSYHSGCSSHVSMRRTITEHIEHSLGQCTSSNIWQRMASHRITCA